MKINQTTWTFIHMQGDGSLIIEKSGEQHEEAKEGSERLQKTHWVHRNNSLTDNSSLGNKMLCCQ